MRSVNSISLFFFLNDKKKNILKRAAKIAVQGIPTRIQLPPPTTAINQSYKMKGTKPTHPHLPFGQTLEHFLPLFPSISQSGYDLPDKISKYPLQFVYLPLSLKERKFPKADLFKYLFN